MLDTFEIVTTAGVVIWSRKWAPVKPSVINNFITDVFVEEKGASSFVKADNSAATNAPYKTEQHTLRWTMVKELGIIFVAVYRSLLHLSWIDKLVDNIKTIFVQLYGDQLTKPNTTQVECSQFDKYFDQQIQELEQLAEKRPVQPQPARATKEKDVVSGKEGDDPPSPEIAPSVESTPVTSRPATPANNAVVGGDASPAAKLSRRARKAVNRTNSAPASGDETASRKTKGAAKQTKKGRKWDDDGLPLEDDPNVKLDYSGDTGDVAVGRSSALEEVDSSTWGATNKGKFVLKDLGDEVHSMLADAEAKKAATSPETANGGLVGTGLSAISGLFRNVIGGKKLTKEDLDKAMKGMEEHLLRKNVAREAAVRLCEGVEKELIGVTTGSFESISTRIQTAMEASLTKMLTPTSSMDLLREIDSVTSPSATSMRKARPYVMSIVGVNGVGKSTNLSKICFFLLQNKYKVLIAAGDTFRSGAVEQLGVHVRNLKELTAREGGEVELYQKGYGKDAATVARDAVQFAGQHGYDVVLIDTAGRRHNDQRLMSSLEKFAKFAQPDKILMVGEALVGTDSVAQARNFNAAFGSVRTLDGFIISKCDTVGDMVGTLVSLVHATNVPILFVGVGQHYSDLRNFSVKWAVEKLLSGN
ncbi:signal recognition particle receptor subunit alpha [Diaporthe amygdali]|uniref:signal recognition particle receptor subunit alpha n=1 Tax=Phomopsis amygdali TaxID=1214568 RepID=UPI0022FE8C9C|nr:signal recognition particle receptor subunit alpha [Diaporthe amygdali]KAJ0123255.1 signal recognition particle receptor subunit alpha [Diaporthe amygdali]